MRWVCPCKMPFDACISGLFTFAQSGFPLASLSLDDIIFRAFPKMASTPSAQELRSPLDSFINILPQGHEKALKQAFYNAATLLFVFLSCGAAVVMYFVLEIFLRPLLWAVLCGTALYPFKYTLSSTLDSWLQGLQDSGTPLVVGTVAIPITLLNFASELLGELVSKWYKILIAVIVGLPLAYLGYQFLDSVWYGLCSVFYVLYETLDYFSTLWVRIFFVYDYCLDIVHRIHSNCHGSEQVLHILYIEGSMAER